MNGVSSDQVISEWSESAVVSWLAALGFAHFEKNIRENKIDGAVLCRLNSESLKDIGVSSIGHRLAILKAVYQVKIAQNDPLEIGDYVPPSELEEKPEITVTMLHNLVNEQEKQLRQVEMENKRLQERLLICFEELGSAQSRRSDDEKTLRKQPSMKWAPMGKAGQSPTKPVPDGVGYSESPHPSPSKPEHDTSSHSHKANREAQHPERPSGITRMASSSNITSPNSSVPGSRTSPANSRGDTSSGGLTGTFKVMLEDPTWKVLPAALKKYKIKDEDWTNYAMFICYGNTDRCLSYDEKPLLLFQRLKDAKKNPVFMLKHIRDIKSPITQAHQKQQARLNARLENNAEGQRPPSNNHPPVRSMSVRQSPSAANMASSKSLTQWPEASSPIVADSSRTNQENSELELKISFAVAIYPYMAEQEDEFDVTVGDTFVILSRAKGWWVVQRDDAGNGVVEIDVAKQKWVPAGCLLETVNPISSDNYSQNPAKAPIPISNIVSTSYPGLALMDYKRKADDELDLYVEDLVRVFKRYNHWSYVVKEDSGERGWVPSWFIGKFSSSGGAPQTPSTSHPPSSFTNQPITLGGPESSGTSPLSNAFQFSANKSTPGYYV